MLSTDEYLVINVQCDDDDGLFQGSCCSFPVYMEDLEERYNYCDYLMEGTAEYADGLDFAERVLEDRHEIIDTFTTYVGFELETNQQMAQLGYALDQIIKEISDYECYEITEVY